MKKFLSTRTEQKTIDQYGREISTVSQQTHVVKCNQEDPFYIVYFKNLASYFKINSTKELYLIAHMCSIANYNEGQVSISIGERKKICELYNLDPSQYSRYIKDLIVKGLLSGEKGTYYINPAIFWKGDKDSRKKLLQSEGISFTIKFVMEGNKTKLFKEE